MRILLGLGLLLVFSLSSAQDKEVRNLGQFYDLNIQGPFKVELKKGSANEISIDSEVIPLDEIETHVRGKELVLKLRSRVYLKEKYFDSDYIRVELRYETVEEIRVSMGGILRSDDVIEQDYLRLEATMGAEADLRIKVEELYGKASMGGVADVSGTADVAEITANMGGEFLASTLVTQRADIRSGMGGMVTIKAEERFRGSASMGGIIRYSGNPRESTNTILGGEIVRSRKN